ncbi:flavin-dependent oxidoreductase [Oricola cellulosilytica]|uniref:Flavin-dependent oxidoreductase n=1 Tax=Oricola cellulosilytica TaxID=1429082 RepID=A0A4R0PCB1_9HYPH|nr:flavin-dependent oxidoreductase [Oricola cellulosilytica]TCD13724.1 flavin-dependent oxidoreductase [Oricola cellulosilytica]
MTILIAGAGIAGLTLALSCHQVGLSCRLFEQVDAIRPLGVGINLQPHAVRELFELGLEEELDAIGVRTREVAYFSSTGRPIWSEPRGRFAGYDWPQFSVHRGQLQMMLVDAVRERLGPNAIETGMKLTGFADHAGGVTAAFRDASGYGVAVEGDILVGADGIHSTVRERLHPDEGPPVWGGAILWRGTAWAELFLSGATMAMAGHERQKFVTYPISRPDSETGRALINFIAELKTDPSRGWRREDYNRTADLEEFLPQFEHWRFDWLDVPALIRSAERIYEYPMIDRDPLDAWTKGHVTLTGDAAHPMYPIGSNGASQAILDARVMVRELLVHGPHRDALTAYENDRRPATTGIVLANRGNGPDAVMQIVEERCGGVFDHIDDVLTPEERATIATDYKKLAGFDVDGLNARPPIVPARGG